MEVCAIAGIVYVEAVVDVFGVEYVFAGAVFARDLVSGFADWEVFLFDLFKFGVGGGGVFFEFF